MFDPFADTGTYPHVAGFSDSFFVKHDVSFSIQFGAATHKGLVRAENQDHYGIFERRRTTRLIKSNLEESQFALPDNRSYAIVVADGVGGMNAGKAASRIALQTMVELSGQATSWITKLSDLDTQQVEERVKAYVDRVNEKLAESGNADARLERMATTWTSLHILGEKAVVVHIGDSRAYLMREGFFEQITRDQTKGQLLEDLGADSDLVRRFRNVLVNSLGGGNPHCEASLYDFQIETGDQLLLCSDGLSDMVSDDDISAMLCEELSLQDKCEGLIRLALENGGKDNVTVVIVNVGVAQPSNVGELRKSKS